MQDTLGMLLICDDEWRYIMDEWLNDEITITNFRQSSWFPCSYCHKMVMLTTKAVILSYFTWLSSQPLYWYFKSHLKLALITYMYVMYFYSLELIL